MNEYNDIIKVWNADAYVIDTDSVIVSGNCPFGYIEPPRNVIDVLNTCQESARQVLKNNLDELASGVEFDFRKLKMFMNRSYGVNKHQVQYNQKKEKE